MSVWKVFDEETASELRSRLEGNNSIELLSHSTAIDSGNAVFLAPTAYPGVTMLITARRKSEPVFNPSLAVVTEEEIVDQPLHAELPPTMQPPLEEAVQHVDSWDSPAIESVPAFEPEPIFEPQIESTSLPAVENPPQSTPSVDEDFFGPTTWERMETAELEAIPEEPIVSRTETYPAPASEPAFDAPPEPATRASEPMPPISQPVIEAPAAPIEAARPANERRYVATGFLGLDETVEDEEDIAREKRPWWKKMFID